MSDSLAQQKRKKEIKQCALQLRKLSEIKENQRCADCGHKPAKWVSTNIGCWLCIRCSGIHRSLGVHISFVKSATLDDWSYKLLRRFESLGGNHAVNSIYEASLKKREKITYSSNEYQTLDFIRNKYVHKKWAAKPLQKQKPQKPKAKKQHSRKHKSAHHRHVHAPAAPVVGAHDRDVVQPQSPPPPPVSHRRVDHEADDGRRQRMHQQPVRELPQIREQAVEVADEQKSSDFTATWVKFEDENDWIQPVLPLSISMDPESDHVDKGREEEAVKDLLDLEQLRRFALSDLSNLNVADRASRAGQEQQQQFSLFDTLEVSQDECKPVDKSAAILSKYHEPQSSAVNVGYSYNYRARGAQNNAYFAMQQPAVYVAYGAGDMDGNVVFDGHDARLVNDRRMSVASQYEEELTEAKQAVLSDNPFRENNNACHYDAGFNPFNHVNSLMNNSNGYYVFNANVSC